MPTLAQQTTNPWDNDPIVAQSADGVQHHFPAGTDPAVIDKAMKAYAQYNTPWQFDPSTAQPVGAFDPSTAQPVPTPSLKDQAIDMLRVVPGGLAKGAAMAGGLSGDTVNLVDRAINSLTGGNSHLLHAALSAFGYNLPTSQALNQEISKPTGGYYVPRTTAGKYAESIASFAPAAIGGAASIPARIARAVLPGIGSEAAGEATAGTKYEPYARAAGGLFGASLPLAARGMANAASYVAPRVLGATTGVGTRAVQEAYRAGSNGGQASAAFTNALRTETPSSDPITMARAALSDLRAERGAAYRSDMSALAHDNHILDFAPIDAQIAKLDAVKNFKGVDTSPSTAGVRAQIKDAVNTWKALPPADFHTPEGFDALKQQLGDIKDAQPFGSPQRVVANGAYNAVRDAIVKQSPGYAKTMEDYTKASERLTELQSELSLKQNANPNTTLRKLQSIMRDNVNTGWGKRQELGDILNARQPDLMPTLAGQALSAPLPRGLARYGDASVLATAATATHNPGLLLSLPFMSPRIVGEAAHGAGATARALRPAVKPLARGYRPGLFGSIPLSLSPSPEMAR